MLKQWERAKSLQRMHDLNVRKYQSVVGFPKHFQNIRCAISWMPSSTSGGQGGDNETDETCSKRTGHLSNADVKARWKLINEAAKKIIATVKKLQECLVWARHLLYVITISLHISAYPNFANLYGPSSSFRRRRMLYNGPKNSPDLNPI